MTKRCATRPRWRCPTRLGQSELPATGQRVEDGGTTMRTTITAQCMQTAASRSTRATRSLRPASPFLCREYRDQAALDPRCRYIVATLTSSISAISATVCCPESYSLRALSTFFGFITDGPHPTTSRGCHQASALSEIREAGCTLKTVPAH